MNERYFIVDLGEPAVFTTSDGREILIERYGVYDTVGRKPQAIDQGSDLEELKRKYATSKVITLPNDKPQV